MNVGLLYHCMALSELVKNCNKAIGFSKEVHSYIQVYILHAQKLHFQI